MNPPRVLSETWVVNRYVVEMQGDAGRVIGQFIDDVDDPEWSMCDRDRAQLAAAAPEMARLLIEHQWDTNDVCPVCNGARVSSVDDDLPPSPGYGHATDCELVAVLRKAGVAC